MAEVPSFSTLDFLQFWGSGLFLEVEEFQEKEGVRTRPSFSCLPGGKVVVGKC